MDEVTRILEVIEAREPQAAERLLPLVYDELRHLAAARLAGEVPGQTLHASALVNVWCAPSWAEIEEAERASDGDRKKNQYRMNQIKTP